MKSEPLNSTRNQSSTSLLRKRPIGIPRLPRQHLDNRLQRLVRAPHVPNSTLEEPEQALDLGALGPDLVVQDGVVRLGRLQAGVEEGLVGCEGGGEVGGEDFAGGEEVRSVVFFLDAFQSVVSVLKSGCDIAGKGGRGG